MNSMRDRSRAALLLALLLLALLLFSAFVPALHTHEGSAEHCPLCMAFFRAESLFRGLLCALAVFGLCAAVRALLCAASGNRPSLPASPVRLRVKLTN